MPSYSNPDAGWVLSLVNDVTVVCMGCNVFIVVFRVRNQGPSEKGVEPVETVIPIYVKIRFQRVSSISNFF